MHKAARWSAARRSRKDSTRLNIEASAALIRRRRSCTSAHRYTEYCKSRRIVFLRELDTDALCGDEEGERRLFVGFVPFTGGGLLVDTTSVRVWITDSSESLGSTYAPFYLRRKKLTNLFLRVATGVTFKQAKGELSKRGWNPDADCKGDSLYWLSPGGKKRGPTYEKLEANSWTAIESGQAKL